MSRLKVSWAWPICSQKGFHERGQMMAFQSLLRSRGIFLFQLRILGSDKWKIYDLSSARLLESPTLLVATDLARRHSFASVYRSQLWYFSLTLASFRSWFFHFFYYRAHKMNIWKWANFGLNCIDTFCSFQDDKWKSALSWLKHWTNLQQKLKFFVII